MLRDKSLVFVHLCVLCPLWSHGALTLTPVSPGDWPTPHLTSDNSGALSQHLPIGCCSRLVSQSIVPAPSPSSPPCRSHCFLRRLSLFLYHRLIHPATRALSGPVSYPAVFTGDESCKKREGGREEGMKKEDSTYMIACIMCSWIHGRLLGVRYEPHAFACLCLLLFTCVRKCFIKREAGGGLRLASSQWSTGILSYVTFTLCPD